MLLGFTVLTGVKRGEKMGYRGEEAVLFSIGSTMMVGNVQIASFLSV